MGCNSVRAQLPQKTLGQTSVPTLLGNLGQVYGKAQISLEILNSSAAIYFLKYGLKKMEGAPVWRPELALYMSRTLQMRKGHSLNFL